MIPRRKSRIFAPVGVKPCIAIECDTFGSILIEVETGHGIALCVPLSKLAAGKRMLYHPLTGTTETLSVGIARATKGDVTPAGEKFCEILRQILDGAITAKAKPGRSSETGRTRNARAVRAPKSLHAPVTTGPGY